MFLALIGVGILLLIWDSGGFTKREQRLVTVIIGILVIFMAIYAYKWTHSPPIPAPPNSAPQPHMLWQDRGWLI